jgi:hypothetical protein
VVQIADISTLCARHANACAQQSLSRGQRARSQHTAIPHDSQAVGHDLGSRRAPGIVSTMPGSTQGGVDQRAPPANQAVTSRIRHVPDRADSRTLSQWCAAKRGLRRGSAVDDAEASGVGPSHEPRMRVAGRAASGPPGGVLWHGCRCRLCVTTTPARVSQVAGFRSVIWGRSGIDPNLRFWRRRKPCLPRVHRCCTGTTFNPTFLSSLPEWNSQPRSTMRRFTLPLRTKRPGARP